MNKIFKFCFIAFMASLALSACESENISDDNLTSEGLVSCTLKWNVADMTAGTVEAKGVSRGDVDADGILSDIENVIILQFDGVDETSLVNRVDYVTNLLDPEIKLLESDTAVMILFIANTFNSNWVTAGQTLAEVKDLGIALSGNLTTTDNGIIYDESLVMTNNDLKYFMFSDCKVYPDGIHSGADIEIDLQRNVAKITLIVSNGWEGQTLNNIDINSVQSNYLYYSNRQHETDEEYPLVPTTVGSSTTYYNIINSVGSESDPVVDTLSFYVPVNMRGYDASSKATTKPKSTCTSGATYTRISYTCQYTDEYGDDITEKIYYTLYLGADLTNDFNLCPNTYYVYNISFYGKGDDVENDARINVIKSFNGTDYTTMKSSNCYILNPKDTDAITFYIPISTRINEYWVDYVGASEAPIGDDDITSWEYKVLWYDTDTDPFNASAPLIIIEKILKNDIPSLAITLDEGICDNMGNVLLAVTQEGSILWSWHLWITDYAPYGHDYTSTDAGVYEVTGGHLHRYTGTVWEEGGIYANKFIMDRNIGAITDTPTDNNHNLLYQFGRKDPFPVSASKDGSAFTVGKTSGVVSMETAVKNPTTNYMSSGNWCSSYTGNKYLWNDQYITDLSGGEKSIFDPSPFGFRLPIESVWDDFTNSSFVSTGTHGVAGFGYSAVLGGVSFFYPACGYTAASSYVYSNPWDLCCYSSATPHQSSGYTSTHATCILKSISLSISLRDYIIRASGTSLRCIEDE